MSKKKKKKKIEMSLTVIRSVVICFIFIFFRPDNQKTIEAVRAKVHHWPNFFEDGLVVYPANAFHSRLRDDLVPIGSSLKNLKKTSVSTYTGHCLCIEHDFDHAFFEAGRHTTVGNQAQV